MTTILAIGYHGGIIMSADTRATGRAIEVRNKVQALDTNVLMGCAGVTNYVEMLTTRMGEAFEQDETLTLWDRINNGLNAYNAEVMERNKTSGLTWQEQRENCYPEGVIAAYDESYQSFKIFQFNLPDPCFEVGSHISPLRAAVGSGSLAATVFLKTVEQVLDEVEMTYEDFSANFIGQLSYLILKGTSVIDPYTSGTNLYDIDKRNHSFIDNRELFNTKGRELAEFLETAYKEIGKESLMKVITSRDLMGFFHSLGLSPF
jgi:20S proteasome alpha/beta subunit